MDFAFPDWRPADPPSRHRQDLLLMDADRHSVLVRQAEEHEDFVLLAEPGPSANAYFEQPRTLAVHVVKFPETMTFSIDWHSAPTPALTVAWLLDRGADENQFRVDVGPEDAPADVTSAQIEERVRRSGSRYTVVEYDDSDPVRSWVLLHDRESAAAARPYLLQLRTELARGGFRLREGSFPDPQSAQQWLEAPGGQPLPPPVLPDPVVSARPAFSRAQAARNPMPAGARTAGPPEATKPTATTADAPSRRPRGQR
ncbi:hypothetical protein ABH940_005561 [Streptacidiphilus sp. BW17]|uniref:hypothetical protein n=1 Tax=Streptacidiphilus sp. BW17 TaxID=3156274 RepID=UPI0035164E27